MNRIRLTRNGNSFLFDETLKSEQNIAANCKIENVTHINTDIQQSFKTF